MSFKQFEYFAGLDMASDHHDVVVVDRAGEIVEQFAFPESETGWLSFREKIAAYDTLPVCLETSSGMIVERLLTANCFVFPINPKVGQRYRERKAPSGCKTNTLDAWAFADALRMDGHHWPMLKPDSEATQTLRLLCRDERNLIQQRTALINRLKATIAEYFPAVAEAFNDFAAPVVWAFVKRFPTPSKLRKTKRQVLTNFLIKHKAFRKSTFEKRMEIFANAEAFCGSPAIIAAKSRFALSIVDQLQTLQKHIKAYEDEIQKYFKEHADYGWFSSLPITMDGKTAPRLLAELGDHRDRFKAASAMQQYGGSAPVYKHSGSNARRPIVRMRRACNKHFRYAMHWYADIVRRKCPWSKIYYEKKKAEGMTHAAALRCLANRWLKIIFRMYQDRAPYSPVRHQENQIKHGSWIIGLNTKQP